MRSPLPVALVGVGGVGEVHLRAYAQADPSPVQVVGAFDPDPVRLAEICARFGLKAYPDLDSLLSDKSVRAVVVCAPAGAHGAIVKACAAASLSVLCEKPLAPSLAEGVEMARACQSAGVRLAYGSTYRFLPAVAEARRAIEAGAIGRIGLMSETAFGAGRHHPLGFSHYPRGGPGGGPMGLMDHGVHLIDIFAWLSGQAVTRAFGRVDQSGGEHRLEHAWLELSGGAQGFLLSDDGLFACSLPAEGVFTKGEGWDIDGLQRPGAWLKQPGFIHVQGDRGALRILHYAHALYLSDGAGAREIPLFGPPAPAHFALQAQAFADALDGRDTPLGAARDGLAALAVIEALDRSGTLRTLEKVETPHI